MPQTPLSFAAGRIVKHALLAAGHYRRALGRSRFPGVAVLGYHGLRRDDAAAGTMAFENLHLRASTFEAHCRVVRDTCDPISIDDWRAALAGSARLPPRPVLITFDDGYRSVLTIGAPVLKALALPAAVFVCSDLVERRRLLWFDDVAARGGESAVEPWKARDYADWLPACAQHTQEVGLDDPRALLTPAEVRELSLQPGIEIGSHTARHPILAHATAAEQRAEIAESRAALERWTGRPVRAFAYPNGRPRVDYTETTIALLAELGFDIAFTTRPAFATSDEPAFERSRFLVVAEVTAAELAHRLAYAWDR
ncbi:MAG: polysaccharide deacetylase family protein [Acidobacteria bacterium]|nr:polysaccharide deacetylase family protein [Acidobacteriota bacterium]